MSPSTTNAPSAAARRAQPKPIPCAAPVTTMTLPPRRLLILRGSTTTERVYAQGSGICTGLRLGSVGGIDANVIGSEVAGPVARNGFACVEVHDDGNSFCQQLVACGAFVKIERLAAPEDLDSGHGDFHEGRIEFDTGAARGRENAAPVGIGTRKSGFHEGRCSDCFGDAFG